MTPYRLTFPPARCPVLRPVLMLCLLGLAPFAGGMTAAPALAGEPPQCLAVSLSDPRTGSERADVILIGEVVEYTEGVRAVLRPEAYLKGPAESADVLLQAPPGSAGCPLAAFEVGRRTLVFLEGAAGALTWPPEGAAFELSLEPGGALMAGGESLSEAELIERLRGVTGQYAVPASGGGGAALDLRSAILPVGAAILALFAIGLVLMRIWHRIDPT